MWQENVCRGFEVCMLGLKIWKLFVMIERQKILSQSVSGLYALGSGLSALRSGMYALANGALWALGFGFWAELEWV